MRTRNSMRLIVVADDGIKKRLRSKQKESSIWVNFGASTTEAISENTGYTSGSVSIQEISARNLARLPNIPIRAQKIEILERSTGRGRKKETEKIKLLDTKAIGSSHPCIIDVSDARFRYDASDARFRYWG
ncbi:hypothetical protein L1887_03506 [Cichorium endivia]|nr:hypothetical protein L1887_03506 [Cichorium endivia]